jgi:hypothetical protein
MSNAKVRARRRRRVQTQAALTAESLCWAPMTPWQYRGLLKRMNFGLPGGMQLHSSRTAIVKQLFEAGVIHIPDPGPSSYWQKHLDERTEINRVLLDDWVDNLPKNSPHVIIKHTSWVQDSDPITDILAGIAAAGYP